NLYIVGTAGGDFDGHTSAGQSDGFLIKYDPDGNVLWSREFGTGVEDQATGVATRANGDVIVVGYTFGDFDGHTNQGNGDSFVISSDASGQELWSNMLGSSAVERATAAATDAAGNAYLLEVTLGVDDVDAGSGGGIDSLLAKYDPSGQLLWSKRLGSV